MPIILDLVLDKLKNINPSKSPGQDGVHPRVLKESCNQLATALHHLFNFSLSNSCLPTDWKTANISAIHKKGPRDTPGNYRPVSLTSVIVKLMESIVRDAVMTFLKDNRVISNKQYGFISGRSTLLQLLTVLDQWTEALDRGDFLDVIYCDFMKAFDKVPHLLLLKQLQTYGIQGLVLNWIRAFLLNRTQRIRVNATHSRSYPVLSGIPQGSVLGPALFIIFINNLPDQVLHSQVFLFADDLKIFKPITQPSDQEQLQEDLDHLMEWSDNSHLKFHPDKCFHMSISTGRQHHDAATYKLGENQLKLSYQETDLGVIIDSKLTFEAHIMAKINKANSLLGIINRTFEFKDSPTMLSLYKTMVRPVLEYCNQVWSPLHMKHITLIENVQRRMTRNLPGLKDLEYEQRLKKLDLPTLAYRRLRGDMIECFKLTTGLYDTEVSNNLLKFSDNQVTRGHQFKLEKRRPRLEIRKNSFFYRIINNWNDLPPSVVQADSINSFKNRLDKHWRHHPIRFNYRSDPKFRA